MYEIFFKLLRNSIKIILKLNEKNILYSFFNNNTRIIYQSKINDFSCKINKTQYNKRNFFHLKLLRVL